MVYLLNIGLILMWNVLLPNTERKKKTLCILYCIQWIIISGFRAYSVGADTYNYKINHFDVISRISLERICISILAYIRGIAVVKGPGYMLFQKICQIFIGKNYTAFLVIIACVFTIPMTVWIYRYSENVCLSFMIYSTLFYSFFAITGHRQTIATAIIVFGGYECMKKNKLVLLLFLSVCAYFFHKSSICFLLLYFAKYIKINKAYWVIANVCVVAAFLFRRQLMYLLGSFLGYEGYAGWTGRAGAYTFMLFLSLLYLASMFLYDRLPQTPETQYSIVALTFAMIFASFTFVNPAGMRVVQFFSLFIMILLPTFLEAFGKLDQYLITAGCYIILIISMLEKMPPYKFVF